MSKGQVVYSAHPQELSDNEEIKSSISASDRAFPEIGAAPIIIPMTLAILTGINRLAPIDIELTLGQDQSRIL